MNPYRPLFVETPQCGCRGVMHTCWGKCSYMCGKFGIAESEWRMMVGRRQ